MVDEADYPLYYMKKFLEMKILRTALIKIIFCAAFITIEVYIIHAIKWMVQCNTVHQYICHVLLFQSSNLIIIPMLTVASNMELSGWKSFGNMQLASSTAKPKIVAHCMRANAIFVFIFVSVIGIHLFAILPIFGDEDDYIYIIPILKYYHGSLFPLFMGLCYACVFLMGFSMAFCLAVVVYIVTLGNTQIRLLNAELLKISTQYKDMEELEDPIRNEIYQNAIYAGIRPCVDQHVSLLRFKTSLSTLKIPLMFMPLTSVIPVAAVLFIYSEVSPRSNIRMVVILIIYVSIISIICVLGQSLDDLSHELFMIISQTPWIHWNKKNRKTVILMLMMADKPLNVTSVNGMQTNYELLLYFHKCIYTLVTVLY